MDGKFFCRCAISGAGLCEFGFQLSSCGDQELRCDALPMSQSLGVLIRRLLSTLNASHERLTIRGNIRKDG